MYSEAKKLHLIEEVIKLKSEAVLMEIEAMINKAKKSRKNSAHEFAGLFSEKDGRLMDAAIEEGCEKINPDDWK